MIENIKSIFQVLAGLAFMALMFMLAIAFNGLVKRFTGISWIEFVYLLMGILLLGSILFAIIEWMNKKLVELRKDKAAGKKPDRSAERVWYYLSLAYISQIIQLLIFPSSSAGVSGIHWIIYPSYQLLGITLFLSLIYGVYRKFKNKTFFHEDKRLFFAIIWKKYFYFTVIMAPLAFILALLTNTL